MSFRRWTLALGTAVLLNAPPPADAQASARPDPRMQRLERWIETVLTHEPGQWDDQDVELGQWRNADWNTIATDGRALVAMMRDPRISVLTERRPGQRVPEVIRYTRGQLARLRHLACALIGVDNAEDCADYRAIILRDPVLSRVAGLAAAVRSGNDTNFLVRRAALFHTDLIVLNLADASEPVENGPRSTAVWIQVSDGLETSRTQSLPHWSMAREFLDLVMPPRATRPAPEHDSMVRDWYRATSSWMQHEEKYEALHLKRALELFPDDADLLFLGGTEHEAYASAAIQAAVRTAPFGALVKFAESERTELREAERLLRRGLEHRPEFPLARLHYGHVLLRLERYEAAATELDQARLSVTEDTDRYVANLFLGAAEESRGNLERARAAYERASGLFPDAQSPSIALSQLARRQGNRDVAIAHIRKVFDLEYFDDRADPWWGYFRSQGRDCESLLVELGRPFQPAVTP